MIAHHTMQEKTQAEDFFAQSQAFVAMAEGGISDHPADRGGVTAHGASLAFVRGIAASQAGKDLLRSLGIAANGEIDREVILGLSREQVAKLFRHEFWDKAGLDQLCASGLHLGPAMVIYDTAVNCGLRTAVRLAQRGFNSLPEGQGSGRGISGARAGSATGQKPDHAAIASSQGRSVARALDATGPTLVPSLVVDGSLGPKTRAALLACDQPALARAILAARCQYYRDIVAARPSQAVFLRGWLARCQRLKARLGL